MIRILLVAPDQELVDSFTGLFKEHEATGARAEYGRETYALSALVARRITDLPSLKFDADVIVSRGFVAAELRRLGFYLPLVEVPIATIDLLRCVVRAARERGCDRVAVVGSASMMMALSGLDDLVPVAVREFEAEARSEVREAVGKAKAEGYPVVIGGAIACEYALEAGLGAEHLISGRESIWHSITEAKRLSFLVRRERERADQLSLLTAGAAHEVNTPLGVSLSAATHAKQNLAAVKAGYAEASMDEEEFFAKLDSALESLDIVEDSLGKAADFMRSFKGIASYRASEDQRIVDVRDFLDEMMKGFEPRLKRSSLAVEIDCPGDMKVEVSAGALYRILSNLVINSLEHAFGEGEAGRIRIGVHKVIGGLRISYRDDGRGISPEIQGRIFEPFFTTARAKGGSGLGLYIAKDLARQLGGDIVCSSEPGRGAAFEMTLPVDLPERRDA